MTQTPTDALRLVPVEPTHQMHYDGDRVLANAVKKGGSIFDTTKAIWKAMLAAAPASPLPRGGDMDWQSVAMWMGFSASVIKNGEPWSDQCQQHYDEAKAAFARLAAPTGDA